MRKFCSNSPTLFNFHPAVLSQEEMDYLDEFYSLEVLPDCPAVILNTGVREEEERRGVWVNRFGQVAPGDSDSETERILLG